jgi:manganese transport protein
MEGFTDLRLPLWARRAVSRAIAIVPAMLIAISYGNAGTARLLIASQVVLTLQLPFAIVPMILLTANRRIMGEFANSRLVTGAAWAAACVIIGMGGLFSATPTG